MMPRWPLMYFGVRGLPAGVSDATTTASPTLYLLVIDSINSLNQAELLAIQARLRFSLLPPTQKVSMPDRRQVNYRRSRASPALLLPCPESLQGAAVERNSGRPMCCHKP